jgi:DNA-3-methyladenine glycosylase II
MTLITTPAPTFPDPGKICYTSMTTLVARPLLKESFAMTILRPWSDTVAEAIKQLSAADAVMADAIASVGDCTLQPNPDVFEALIDAIVSQQISVTAADAIVARLRAAANGQITPEAMLLLQHADLRAAGLSTPKARYVRDLSERVVSGELNLAVFERLADEDIIARLVAVKGIGRWTSEMILIFALGRPDVLPVDDLGFVEGVRAAYQLAARPTRQELLERGEAWRPYRTFATWYMWGLRRLSQRQARARTRIVSL